MPQDLISQFDRKYALPIETYRQVQNLTQRNAIPAPIRWEGMMCYVISEGLSYVLTAGMENSDWVEFGALVDVTVVDNLLSTSSTDALSANQGRVLQNTKLSDAPSDGNTYGRLDGAWAVVGGGAVDSVFGRTGAVVAQTGDYTFAQIGSKPTTIGGYGITDAYTKTEADGKYLLNTTDTLSGNLLVTGEVRAESGGIFVSRVNQSMNSSPLGSISFFDDRVDRYSYIEGYRYASSQTIGLKFYVSNGASPMLGAEITNAGILNVTGQITAAGSAVWNAGNDGAGSGLDADLLDGLDSTAFQTRNEKGAANGYTPLDSGAKVPIAYLPDSVIGQVQYQGTWAASTNTPTLANPPAASTKGHYYVASDNGTQFGISFQTGDWIISNGTAWEKVDNTDAVTSVFGRIGAVVANAGDYTFAQIGSTPTTLSGYGITDAVPTSRTLTAGDGLTGGGNLTANRSFAVDGTVVRTSGTQSIGGAKTFETNLTVNGSITGDLVIAASIRSSNRQMVGESGSELFLGDYGGGTSTVSLRGSNDPIFFNGSTNTIWHSGNLTPSNYVPTSRTLTAGDGLTGGGSLAANRTFAVDGTVVRTTGTQSIGGAKTFTSNVIGSGTFTGTNFILSSDRRLKKNIRDYSPTPLPIKWKTFDWKSGAKNQIGVIAQEVQEVAPHLVEKAKDGTLSVRMIDLLVAKVAELEARIINLER